MLIEYLGHNMYQSTLHEIRLLISIEYLYWKWITFLLVGPDGNIIGVFKMIFLDRYQLNFYGFIDSRGNMLSD